MLFAAGGANDGELTSEIYEHHGGNDAPNLKQCRRRYRAHHSDGGASVCHSAVTRCAAVRRVSYGTSRQRTPCLAGDYLDFLELLVGMPKQMYVSEGPAPLCQVSGGARPMAVKLWARNGH